MVLSEPGLQAEERTPKAQGREEAVCNLETKSGLKMRSEFFCFLISVPFASQMQS